jgi:hypothetical protein
MNVEERILKRTAQCDSAPDGRNEGKGMYKRMTRSEDIIINARQGRARLEEYV